VDETTDRELVRVRVTRPVADMLHEQARKERVWPRDVVEAAVRLYVETESNRRAS
jgi:hypothetical protein